VGAGAIALAAALLVASASWGVVTPPYPPSPIIQRLDWHETLNLGTDNDNWPTTWANDDYVYTAGGDGNGFGGDRGNWICRLLGFTPVVSGENITRISTGGGPVGIKGSGLLSIGGTLYLWVRNADDNGHYGRLGWSADHGQTWTWGPTFTTLGYPTFLNFGKDYAGARDQYVYTVSHDNPSAYAASDHFILLRVLRIHITDLSAYQYFVGMSGGSPLWSYDPALRGAVFTHVNAGAGRCERSGISYDAALGRYLWWQQYPADDGGHTQGFGIYDAPQPWGPWTTTYFTTAWDEDPGECGGFCTKYTSPDGNTLRLVYSGSDNLRMRRATLTRVAVSAPLPAQSSAEARAYPNPFTSGTRADFSVARPCMVKIDVQDVRGRLVTTLLNESLVAGAHSVAWNGWDEQGRRAASGVYFLRVNVGGDVNTLRVVRLR
jgi:hypothetical protein